MSPTMTAYSTLVSKGIIPDPKPVAPPGTQGISTLLNWITWGVIIAAVAGFLLAAGSLAFAQYSGRSSDNFKGLAFAMLAAILAGSVGVIMRTFA